LFFLSLVFNSNRNQESKTFHQDNGIAAFVKTFSLFHGLRITQSILYAQLLKSLCGNVTSFGTIIV